jgi:hypothetical protein
MLYVIELAQCGREQPWCGTDIELEVARADRLEQPDRSPERGDLQTRPPAGSAPLPSDARRTHSAPDRLKPTRRQINSSPHQQVLHGPQQQRQNGGRPHDSKKLEHNIRTLKSTRRGLKQNFKFGL